MFIAPLPLDEHGSRTNYAQVIEVERVPDPMPEWEDRAVYQVIVPQSYAQRWSALSSDVVDHYWIAVPGPVRTLTEQEWYDLLLLVGVDAEHLAWARKRLK